ncbi:hypothetical protein H6P81_008239 [Aristolochia fimbriata]|uniref:RNA helicase n=1 Tax=Aristolochia fimbriata TaxID=158543 RepID=A0AAV7F4T7_ARIFI|nr:hypothetical protein H6P81_008239 [Aristolochia fimbriata]
MSLHILFDNAPRGGGGRSPGVNPTKISSGSEGWRKPGSVTPNSLKIRTCCLLLREQRTIHFRNFENRESLRVYPRVAQLLPSKEYSVVELTADGFLLVEERLNDRLLEAGTLPLSCLEDILSGYMAENEKNALNQQTKPQEKRLWGDEVDEPVEESATANSTSDHKDPEVNIGKLTIDEKDKSEQSREPDDTIDEKEKPEQLKEPDDLKIETFTSGDTIYSSAAMFEDLNLSQELLRGLYTEMLFKKPSKIQAISLPMILTPPYKNLVAQAHNGSGKTTCFVLGMLSRVDPRRKAPQAFCICPTRELAIQNQQVLLKMGKYTGITSMCAVPMDSSNYVPIAKCSPVTDQVVIGTPGTIKKWMGAKKLSTRDVKILVFDEADHMLAEDGFKDDSLRIMKDIERNSPGCQVLLFSATFNETVKDFVTRVIKDANRLFVKKEELSLDAIKQYKVFCPDELAKNEVIKDKIFELGKNWGQTIIFVRTRRDADRLYKELEAYGYDCTSIHGATAQEERDRKVEEFKKGLTKVLISTDLLSRGFDQQQVGLVVNYDLPVKHETMEPDYEVYLHRIGRAGRFGRKGAVFNLLCTERDHMIMEKIEKHFDHEVVTVPKWSSEEDFVAALNQAGLF